MLYFIETLKYSVSKFPFLRFSKGNKFIFLYHDIFDKESRYHFPFCSTNKSIFEKQVAFLQKNFNLVSLKEIINDHLPLKKNYACIVFDDGFYSVKSIAYPILYSKGIPFSVFINKRAVENNRLWITDIALNLKNSEFIKSVYSIFNEINNSSVSYQSFIENPNLYLMNSFSSKIIKKIELLTPENKYKLYLDTKDIQFLYAKGVGIENHSVNHFVLSKSAENEIMQEISENSSFIKSIIGTTVEYFAIPFGKKEHFIPDLIIKLCEVNNIKHLFSTNPASLPHFVEDKKHCILPRIGITNESISELSFYINRTFLKSYNL